MVTRRELPAGLYDAAITAELDGALSSLAEELREIEALDPTDSPRALARLVHTRLLHALSSFPTSPRGGQPSDALARQVSLTNEVLTLLEGVAGSGASPHRGGLARHLVNPS